MRRLLLGLILCLVAASSAFAAAPAELTLKGDQLFVHQGGTSVPLSKETFPAQPVEGTDKRFLGVGADDGKDYGIAAGLYVFAGDGKPVAFTATDDAEFCSEIRFSPDGKILAMDSGTWHIRSWSFYSFPGMQAMGEISYLSPREPLPALLWVDGKGVLFSEMDTEGGGRTCGYDPCGPVSVSFFSFETRESQSLFQGTNACDYSLSGYQEKDFSVTAEELCLDSPKDWEVYPYGEKAVKTVSKKFP